MGGLQHSQRDFFLDELKTLEQRSHQRVQIKRKFYNGIPNVSVWRVLRNGLQDYYIKLKNISPSLIFTY
jgi:hypothetical protein